MEALKDRPPYVTFEMRAVEDRAESIRCGVRITKDVPFVFVTPAGSRDRVEKEAERWLEDKARDAEAGRMNPDWLRGFISKYESWKQGQEVPVDGTPIGSWTLLSPAQTQNLKSLGLQTVEDVAAANAEVLGRIGMGALELKQRAIDWLKSAQDTGRTAAELDKLRVDLAMAMGRIEQLEATNRELESALKAAPESADDQPKRRGRPPKEPDEIGLEL